MADQLINISMPTRHLKRLLSKPDSLQIQVIYILDCNKPKEALYKEILVLVDQLNI